MFGPVFTSELARTARRQRHVWIRALYVGLLLTVLWIAYYSIFRGGSVPRTHVTMGEIALFAQQFFFAFAVLQLLASLLVTMAITSGTIAEERDRRTIEYLFVTQLSNHEIVLDKLAVRLLHILCLLLAAVPVLVLSMLFGGVGIGQLIELTVLTIGTVIGTACLSIYVSVTTRRAREAMIRILVLLVAGLTVPSVLRDTLLHSTLTVDLWVYETLDQFRAMNPFVHLFSSMQTAAQAGPGNLDSLSLFVRNVALGSTIFLGLAVVQVRRTHLRAAARAGARRRGPLRWFRAPTIGNHPVLWKELFAERFIQREHRWSAWVAPAGLVLAVTGIAIYYVLVRSGYYDLRPRDFVESARGIELILGCIFVFLAGARASVSISHEREQSTWDTLLTTSLDPQEVLFAKVAGSLYVLRGLFVVYAMVWCLELSVQAEQWWRGVGAMATTLLLGTFSSALGVLISQRARSSTRAMSWLVAMAVVLGGGYLLIALPAALLFVSHRESIVVLALCIPYLQSFWLWYEPQWRNLAIDPLPLYVAGSLLYATATAAIMAINLAMFDRHARGLERRRFFLPRPLPPPEMATAEGSVVPRQPARADAL